MDIITVNVGQGSLSIIRHNFEVVIADSRIPPTEDDTVAYVKGILSTYLKNHYVRGLVLTGFDSDHADATGVGLILKKYRPDWIMYSKYYKDTKEASKVFQIIEQQQRERRLTSNPLKRVSVCLDNVDSRILTTLSPHFEFELFSPHTHDMDNSNNSSLVLRLRGKGPGGFVYLITGDTESARWKTINRLFKACIKSDVMAAPHHGSKSGANAETLLLVEPNTILISAGVDNQYGHPDNQVMHAYSKVAKHVHSTHVKKGVSLFTKPLGNGDFGTTPF